MTDENTPIMHLAGPFVFDGTDEEIAACEPTATLEEIEAMLSAARILVDATEFAIDFVPSRWATFAGCEGQNLAAEAIVQRAAELLAEHEGAE
jgi:hypothetical protein